MQLPVANSPSRRHVRAPAHAPAPRAARADALALRAGGGLALIPAWVIGEITNFASDHQLTTRSIAVYVGDAGRLLARPARSDVLRATRSYVLGETVFAQLREEFLESVLALPLVEVERAGTGDLLSRTTNDMESLSRTVRFAMPEWLVAILQAVLTLGAMLLVSPLASVASLVSLPFLFFSTRYYLRYATPGYRRERMSYATMSGTVAETAEGARTVDALPARPRQARRIEDNVRESFYSEMYTLLLRMLWFPTVEGAFALAVAATLAWSGWLAITGHVSIGAATTVTLYVVQINDPLDRIVSWLDELQIGQTSLARLVGVSVVQDDRPTDGTRAANETITMQDVRYAYRKGHDVLNGVTLTVARRTTRHRRALGRRQVDDRATARGHRRPAHRLGARRRGRAGPDAPRRPAPPRGARHPGAPHLHRHGARQPGAGAHRGDRRRDHERARRRRRARVGEAPPPRVSTPSSARRATRSRRPRPSSWPSRVSS